MNNNETTLEQDLTAARQELAAAEENFRQARRDVKSAKDRVAVLEKYAKQFGVIMDAGAPSAVEEPAPAVSEVYVPDERAHDEAF